MDTLEKIDISAVASGAAVRGKKRGATQGPRCNGPFASKRARMERGGMQRGDVYARLERVVYRRVVLP